MQLTQQPKITQSLVMTAQLQQAIRILQLSTPDLAAEIERAFLENPLLEMEEGDDAPAQETPLVYDEGRERAEDAFAAAYDADDPYESETCAERTHSDFAAPVALSLEEELLREVDVRFADRVEKAIAVFLVGSLDADRRGGARDARVDRQPRRCEQIHRPAARTRPAQIVLLLCRRHGSGSAQRRRGARGDRRHHRGRGCGETALGRAHR